MIMFNKIVNYFKNLDKLTKLIMNNGLKFCLFLGLISIAVLVTYNFSLTIPILFTESQHDLLKARADANKDSYWFIKLPDSTAETTGKPLVFYFTADCDLGMDTIAIDDMLKENLTLYRSSEVQESKGFPTVSGS